MKAGHIFTAFLIASAVCLGTYEYLPSGIPLSLGGVSALLWLLIVKIRQGNERGSPEEMILLLALEGAEKQTRRLYSTLPDDKKVMIKPPYFVTETNGKKVAVAALYKFFDLNREDLAAAHRFCEKEGIRRVIILTSGRKRSVLQLTTLLPEKFEFPTKRKVYKYLYNRNALPKRPQKNNNRIKSMSFEELTDLLFDPAKLKYYLLVAAVFLATSLLFSWYLYMAILPLTLAAATSFRRARRS